MRYCQAVGQACGGACERGEHRLDGTDQGTRARPPSASSSPGPGHLDAAADGRADRDRTEVLIWVLAAVGIALRWVMAARPGLTNDEMYTAVVARRPLGDIASFVASDDFHGPLDYLLRHPFAGGDSVIALRAPSAIFSSLAMVLVARWMRHRGWFGVAVTALSALSGFLLLWGSEARMYSLLILCGTIVAISSDHWWRTPRRAFAATAAVAVLVALLADPTGLLLLGGALLVPGLTTAAGAWWWRGALLGAAVVFLVLWGPSLAGQVGTGGAWMPYTTVGGALDAVNGLVSPFYPFTGVLVVALLVAGGVALGRSDAVLARCVVVLAAIPIATVIVAGLFLRLLTTRAMAVCAWAAPVALAAAIEAARRRSAPLGAAIALLVAVLVVPSTIQALGYRSDLREALAQLHATLEPGDAVGQVAAGGSHVLVWEFDVDVPTAGTDVPSLYVAALPGAEPTGRVWVLRHTPSPTVASLPPCPGEEPLRGPDWRIECVELDLDGRATLVLPA